MNDLKYIVLQLPGMYTNSVALFRGSINHCDMVPPDAEVLSAGLCTINWNPENLCMEIKCFGSAPSVKSKPSENDPLAIRQLIERTYNPFLF